jgi:hypothetical protein
VTAKALRAARFHSVEAMRAAVAEVVSAEERTRLAADADNTHGELISGELAALWAWWGALPTARRRHRMSDHRSDRCSTQR